MSIRFPSPCPGSHLARAFLYPVVDFQLAKMFTFLHVDNEIINKLKIHYRAELAFSQIL